MALLDRFAGLLSSVSGWRLAPGARLGILLLASATMVRAEPRAVTEYDIKAVFLFNFIQFVDWPPAVADKKILVIGVLGRDPFGERLDEVVQGEHVDHRTLVIRRIKSIAEAEGCDALFISRSEQAALPQILKWLDRRPVLTVSDIPGFAETGGMIGMVAEADKIRLQINVDASRLATLAISAKLLRPAQIVSTHKSSQYRFDPPGRLFANWGGPVNPPAAVFLYSREAP